MKCQFCKQGFSATAPVVRYAGKRYHTVCILKLAEIAIRTGGVL